MSYALDKRVRAAATALLLIAAMARSNLVTGAVAVEDVVKAWESRTARTKTVRMKWNDSYTVAAGDYLKPLPDGIADPANPRNLTVPAETTTFVTSFSLVIDGAFIRHDGKHVTLSVNQELVPQEYAWVWFNDEFKKLIQPGGAPHPRGHVSQTTHVTWYPADDPNLVPLMMAFRPFHPTFGQFARLTERFRVMSGQYVMQERNCVLLKEQARAGSDVTTSLFLDPARDFVVVSRIRQKTDGSELSRTTFHDFRECEGTWVPIRWNTTFVNDDGSVGTTSSSQATDIAVNGPVVPNEFEIEFPVGTLVTETGVPDRFLVKEGGKRRTIARAEAMSGAKYEDLLNSETGQLAQAQRRALDAHRRRVLAADAAVVGAVVLAIFVVFRRIRKTQRP